MTYTTLKNKLPLTWQMIPIVCLAFFVRLINLNGRFLWYDEAFAVLYAEKSFAAMLHGTITQVAGVAADVHPLFYYSLLHGWMKMTGQSPFAIRIFSAFLSTITVVLVYILAQHLFEKRTALYAALLASLSPFLVYYGQETRMYALLSFAATSFVYIFVRAWSQNRWWQWLIMGIFGAITLYAHNLGAMFIASLDLWVLWQWFRARRLTHWQGIVSANLIIIILFAPWLTILPAQLGKIQQSYWVQKPGLLELLQTTLIFHFAYDNQTLQSWLLPLAFAFSLFIPTVLILELRRHHKNPYAYPSSFSNSISLLLFLVIGPILLTFLGSQIHPVYIVRALIPSATMYLLLIIGVLNAKQTPKPIKWGMALPSLAIILLALFNHYTYAQFPRSPFTDAIAYLQDSANLSTDTIVHSNKLTFFPTHYYKHQLPMSFIADEPGSFSDTLAWPTQEALGLFATPDMETAVNGHATVWFFIFKSALKEYSEEQQKHPHLIWLDANYQQDELVEFNDLLLFKYSKKDR